MELMKSLWSDESGQGLTEYAVIIALVAVGLILVLVAFREAIANVFRDTTSELNNATVNQSQP
jgi:Flp pilus assembly pilin Flp